MTPNDDQLTNFLQKSGLLHDPAKPKSKSAPTSGAHQPQPKREQPAPRRKKKRHQPPSSSPQKSAEQQKRRNFSPQKSGQKSSPSPQKHRFNRGKKSGPRPPQKTEQRSKNTPQYQTLTPGRNRLPQRFNDQGEIKVVPLGGLEQVGQNMLFLEWKDDILLIDTGVEFPSPEHLGVDMIVPDISYLVERKKKIRGVIYTHGHLDHIGGAQYLMADLGHPPMFATKLTKELLLASPDDERIAKKFRITQIDRRTKLKLGRFAVEFFHVNHSIPDSMGVVVKTPYGSIVHTGDFKIDPTPSDEKPADLSRIAKVGNDGVALAMVDSTNALVPGHTISESVIEAELGKLLKSIQGRVILATFASNIGRIAKIIEAAEKLGRTVFLSGRSMERNVAIARKLKYLRCKEKTLKRMSPAAEKMDPGKVLILSTGTQGEELAALTRMAAGTHKMIRLNPADTVVFSSSTIPGNELAIVSVLNNLSERGVRRIDNNQLDSHVSGHGQAEEVKLMTSLLKPRFIAPIHGELYMRYGHRDMIVKSLKFPKENSFIMKNGQGVVLGHRGARMMTDREAISAAPVLIELGEKMGEHVLADRTLMADGGVIFVTLGLEKGKLKNLDVRSRGFRYMGQKHEIFKMIEKDVRRMFDQHYDPSRPERALETTIAKSIQKLLWQKFKKDSLVEVVVSP
ncbi:MAG: RNase J family beta-CASP ribonuclease [Candidatus Gracilibacteria bacterium]|nr:RNase J family beta-CASP ribonuclease [Candidatus Gracilibacteria bacterium]